jgi:hypothetical protein
MHALEPLTNGRGYRIPGGVVDEDDIEVRRIACLEALYTLNRVIKAIPGQNDRRHTGPPGIGGRGCYGSAPG